MMKFSYIYYLVYCCFACGLFAEQVSIDKIRKLEYQLFSKDQQSIGKYVQCDTIHQEGRNSSFLGEINLNVGKKRHTFFSRSAVYWSGLLQPDTFEHWLIEDKERWHLKGAKTHDSGYVVSAYKVRAKQDQELDVSGLAEQLLSHAEPHTGQLLSLFSEEKSKGEDWVPLRCFDAMDLSLPTFLWEKEFWSGIQKWKVFLTEDLDIKTFSFSCLNDLSINTPAGVFPCRVYELKSRKIKKQLWIAYDEVWGAWIVREKGKDSGLEYDLMIQSIK